MTFRVWVIELAVTAVNYFLLVKKVHEPRYGKLRAHQIGMSTRIACIFVFAYFILFFAKRYTTLDTFYAGVFWLLLILAFEWIGSFSVQLQAVFARLRQKVWVAGDAGCRGVQRPRGPLRRPVLYGPDRRRGPSGPLAGWCALLGD